jgi:hypothetical protein
MESHEITPIAIRRAVPRRRRYLAYLSGGALAVVVAVLAVVGAERGTARPAVAQAPSRCSAPFDATVYSGGGTGYTLRGTLDLEIGPSGGVSGQLTRAAGAAGPEGGPAGGRGVGAEGEVVPVVGQAVGRSLSLVFDVGAAGVVVAVGAGTNDIGECRGFVGGTIAGPGLGDSGDWVYICILRRVAEC